MILLFASLMIAASFSMIRTKKQQEINASNHKNQKVIIQGLFVGMITGLIGAGGGFLIIPALILLCNLPMKKAVGTALLIIAVNSLFGFSVDFYSGVKINWTLLLTVTSLAIGGIFIGNFISKKIDGNSLKKGFGWFVLTMGVYILVDLLLHK
ncbi:MAG: sulfite exporter TauE/SafE family protein [Crocinitomicaceae bacterium]|nr:sulfite exporter TauE/SafE family protein [Crocinitomicaceae bacterium]